MKNSFNITILILFYLYNYINNMDSSNLKNIYTKLLDFEFNYYDDNNNLTKENLGLLINQWYYDFTDQIHYGKMLRGIELFLLNGFDNITGSNPRILMTNADGTVALDTGKNNNSFANYLKKDINENHNSRLSIIRALQGENDGICFETKLSSSIRSVQTYMSVRVGGSTEDAAGVVRLSYVSKSFTTVSNQ